MPNSATFALALFSMHQAGVLREPTCKSAVKVFIRGVSEDAHWHFSAHYRSKKAAEIIKAAKPNTRAKYQAFCRKNLRHEHMVPGEVVYRLLIGMRNPTLDSIAALLQKTAYRSTITKEEDRKLLRHSMPYETGDPEMGAFPDHLARYKHAKIHEELELRPANGWL